MIRVIRESSTASTYKWSTKAAVELASQYDSVLDVGCGDGRIIKQVRAKIRYGVDACELALRHARRNDDAVRFLHMDLNRVIDGWMHLPVVDCVIGLDIIEHFEMQNAYALLRECEIVAQKALIFFIPVGNHPQTKDDRGFGNDHFMTHRSTWLPTHMDKLGYDVWFYPDWHKKAGPEKDKGAMWCLKKQV